MQKLPSATFRHRKKPCTEDVEAQGSDRKAFTHYIYNVQQVAARRSKAERIDRSEPDRMYSEPIDTNVFCKADKAEARRKLGLPTDKRLILFASQRVTNQNKGMSYLVDACRKMVEQHPENVSKHRSCSARRTH